MTKGSITMDDDDTVTTTTSRWYQNLIKQWVIQLYYRIYNLKLYKEFIIYKYDN